MRLQAAYNSKWQLEENSELKGHLRALKLG